MNQWIILKRNPPKHEMSETIYYDKENVILRDAPGRPLEIHHGSEKSGTWSPYTGDHSYARHVSRIISEEEATKFMDDEPGLKNE